MLMVRIPWSIAARKVSMKEKVSHLSNEKWIMTSGNRVSKIWFPLTDSTKSKEIYRLSRKQVSTIMQILTGHSELGYFQHKLGKITSPICTQCGLYPETVEHYIGICIKFHYERKKIFDQHIIEPYQFQFLTIKGLNKFVSLTKRFEQTS